MWSTFYCFSVWLLSCLPC